MSDMVKAALIIGIAIVLSQGFYEVSATGKGVAFKVNKFTGNTEVCLGKRCYETISIKEAGDKKPWEMNWNGNNN